MLSWLNSKKNATAANTRRATTNPAAEIINVANRKLRHPMNVVPGHEIKDVGSKVSLRAPAAKRLSTGYAPGFKRTWEELLQSGEFEVGYAARQRCLIVSNTTVTRTK